MQSNRLTNSVYELTLTQKRIINLAIVKGNEAGVAYFTLKEYMQLYGLGKDKALRNIQAEKDKLISLNVGINYDNGDYEKHVWFQSVEYTKINNTWRLTFGDRILKEVTALKEKFTKFDIANVGKLKNVFTIRLYEHIAQFKSAPMSQGVDLSVDYLRKHFVLPDSYNDFFNMKTRFLNPACTEISEKTDYLLKWEVAEKIGKKVTKLKFSFCKKMESLEVAY